jgi:predicted TPR repeat methyltransferase
VFGDAIKEKLGEHIEQKEVPVHELTLEEVMEIAVAFHRDGRLTEAMTVYTEVLKMHPEQAVALHYSGVIANQVGRSDDALELIEKSLELVSDRADWHSNLGIVQQELGRLDEAIAAYHRAIELDPGHANAHSNLGVLLRATGKPAEAEEAYRTAIRLNPEHIDAYTNLGILLNSVNRTEEAVACFWRAITLKPKHREARRHLAIAHCMLGEFGAAIKIFEDWLKEEPGDPIATHMLAAVSGRETPARASNDFVERTFDRFAASFESKLAILQYRAPALVGAMLEDSAVEPAKQLDVLDAGCGTGLCSPFLEPYARHLTGVDLSKGMLEHAREKQAYDDLVQGELTAYLRDHPLAFDVIASADTLVYFGALDELVAAAAAALREGGQLIFTLERAVADTVQDFHLEMHGRYTHAQSYVERLLAAAGLTPEIGHAELRLESGKPVAGLVVRARKQPGNSSSMPRGH